MPVLCNQFHNRVKTILGSEKVDHDPKIVAELIMKHQPDWRRVINELQRYGSGGIIDSGILVNLADDSIDDLIKFLKLKDFRKMRQWVADNMDSEPAAIFRKLYDTMYDYIDGKSIPQLVLILADYQYKNSFVADHELNLVACLTEIMANTEFK